MVITVSLILQQGSVFQDGFQLEQAKGGERTTHGAKRWAPLAVERIACGKDDAYSQDGLERGGDDINQ